MGKNGATVLGSRNAQAAARRLLATSAAGCALAIVNAGEAFAHAADRGHVMLLPTGYYLVGGAAAVALTFVVLLLVPADVLSSLYGRRLAIGSLPKWPRLAGSAVCFAFLAALVAVGFAGSRDPLSNPLPLMLWTVFWIGLTLLQGVVGNLWWWINPLYAPWRLLAGLTRKGGGMIALPERFGYAPAVSQFFAFAWFELVYPAPDDPARLASVVSAYFLLNLLATVVFGYESWMRRGECLSVFLRMIAMLGVAEGGTTARRRRRVALCLPGAKLVAAGGLPLSGALFLLLALSTVSFDGLMRTFFWLGLNGVNPLEYPGRTALVGINSAGLAIAFVVLAGAFVGAVLLGQRFAHGASPGGRAATGALVWSIIPISMAYHFSHYLTALVINGQYALAALSDPLMTGADLFGTAGMHVRAGALMGAEMAWLIWNLQAIAIIGGHLLAVLVAHAIAHRLHGDAVSAGRSQIPLAALMVAYTVFGLWLLSSPTAG